MAAKKYSEGVDSLESLLNLDGEIFLMEDGYWTNFEINRVPPSPHIPHGIRYSRTFNDRNNTRILGFDNAHIVKAKRRKYGDRKITLDHKHKPIFCIGLSVKPVSLSVQSQMVRCACPVHY